MFLFQVSETSAYAINTRRASSLTGQQRKMFGVVSKKGVAIPKVLIERFYCITKAPKLTIQKQTSSTETKQVTWNVQLLDHTSCKGIYAIRSCCICYLQSLYMLFSVTVYGKSRLATLARHCFLKKV